MSDKTTAESRGEILQHSMPRFGMGASSKRARLVNRMA